MTFSPKNLSASLAQLARAQVSYYRMSNELALRNPEVASSSLAGGKSFGVFFVYFM